MSYQTVAVFLKLERERKQIEAALCSPELKAKMLDALAGRRRELEALYGVGDQSTPSPQEPAADAVRKSK